MSGNHNETIREPGPDGTFGKSDRPPVAPLIRKAFKGVLVLNSDFDFARGQAAAAANRFAKDIALAVEG
jgi:hypothetical protein